MSHNLCAEPLGRFGAADREAVAAALDQAGVETLADRMVETLSGGERQRAWLALLLAQGADCLLLDEPTSALDVAHQTEMLGLVRRLSAERALSVIVVLHDVNMAARFCDEIIALHSGRVIARGGPRDIMQPDALQRIYGIAMGVAEHPTAARPLCYAL
jgi:iron complex transport system ATP-binding protein